MSLRDEVTEKLEAIIDPCSKAAGAPAGLISMGMVGDIDITQRPDGPHVAVTLYITEPGCLMASLFQMTATRELSRLAGVHSVDVQVDYGHIWGPEQMTPAYRARLDAYRADQVAHRRATQSCHGAGAQAGGSPNVPTRTVQQKL
jgi:metal-sulfur cluster biosynthetic enzyme